MPFSEYLKSPVVNLLGFGDGVNWLGNLPCDAHWSMSLYCTRPLWTSSNALAGMAAFQSLLAAATSTQAHSIQRGPGALRRKTVAGSLESLWRRRERHIAGVAAGGELLQCVWTRRGRPARSTTVRCRQRLALRVAGLCRPRRPVIGEVLARRWIEIEPVVQRLLDEVSVVHPLRSLSGSLAAVVLGPGRIFQLRDLGDHRPQVSDDLIEIAQLCRAVRGELRREVAREARRCGATEPGPFAALCRQLGRGGRERLFQPSGHAEVERDIWRAMKSRNGLFIRCHDKSPRQKLAAGRAPLPEP